MSIGVDILECPIGFTQISGQCHCERLLDTSNVQCNLSATPFKFLRSGSSWFAYNNNTQCITGTTNWWWPFTTAINPMCSCYGDNHGSSCSGCQMRQCVANRVAGGSHILCFSVPNASLTLSIMLGSNHCGTCSNWYLFWYAGVFPQAGIVLVAGVHVGSST